MGFTRSFVVSMAILLIASQVRAFDDPELDLYLREAQRIFELLRPKLPPDRAEFWMNEQFNRVMAEERWTKEREKTDKQIFAALGPSYSSVAPYSYLADFAELQLRNRTEVVEGVGAELLRAAISARVTPRLNALETKLMEARHSGEPSALAPAVRTLFASRADVATLSSSPPIYRKFTFAPQSSAYDADPSIRGEFVLHDWSAALRSVGEIEKRIGIAEREVEVRQFLAPRDPRSEVSLALQIAFLLIAIAGYIVSFAERPKIGVIAVVVAASMLLSLIMIFYSTDTLLNVLIQSLAPGAFILWWAWKKQRSAPTV